MVTCSICGRAFSKQGLPPHTWRAHGGGYRPNKAKLPKPKKKRVAWNKGLDKKDPRVARNAESLSVSIRKRVKDGTYVRTVHTSETKTLLSKKRSQYLENIGSGGFRDVSWFRIENINKEEYVVRGTWELKVAEWLNRNNLLWVRRTYLSYTTDDGVKRTYTPDFFLPQTNLYIEVKGYFSKKDKNKISRVLAQNNIKLKLLMKPEISNIEKNIFTVEDLHGNENAPVG